MNKNDRARRHDGDLSSLDEDLKQLQTPDWTPRMAIMMKVLPAGRPFHKALVLLDKRLARVRAATGKVIEDNALAARVIPRILHPLEIGELDPVMLGVGLGIARLAASLESLLNFPLLALPLGIAEGRRTKMGSKPGLHMERLRDMEDEVAQLVILNEPLKDVHLSIDSEGNFIMGQPKPSPHNVKLKVPFEQILNPPHPYPGKSSVPMDLTDPVPLLTKEAQAKRDQAQHEAIIANARAAEKEEQERQRAAAEKEEELKRQLAAEAQAPPQGAGNVQLPWQVSQVATKESAPPAAPPSLPLERAAPTVNELEASSSSRRSRRAPSS